MEMKMSFFEKLASWKEEYQIVKYIFLDFSDYPNLKISFPIGMFLILACVAFCVAAFVMCRREAATVYLLRQLVRHGAKDEASAKSAKALGISEKLQKKLLAREGRLASLVLIAGYEQPSYEEYEKLRRSKKKAPVCPIAADDARYYLNGDFAETAQKAAEANEPTLLKPIIISLVLIVAFAALFLVMPNLLEALNAWLAN